MSRIRIGVVGLGWVATHRHLPVLARHPAFELVGLADRDVGLAKRYAKAFGVPSYCSAERPAELTWLRDADALDIATAPMAHYDYASFALQAGKHVITEKPFAMTVSEGARLVELAASNRRQLAIVHNFQFASSTRRLLADLDSGRLGRIRSIVAVQWGNPDRRLPRWYDDLPAGLFFDESPHLLYLIRRLAPGPLDLVSVESSPSTLGKTTPASIDASFRSGPAPSIPVSLHCRFEAPLSEWHVCVLAEHAAGIVDVFRDVYLRVPNDRGHATLDVLRSSVAASWQHWVGYLKNGPLHLRGRLLYGNREVFDRFAEGVSNNRQCDRISGRDALDVLQMQFDIIERALGPGGASRE